MSSLSAFFWGEKRTSAQRHAFCIYSEIEEEQIHGTLCRTKIISPGSELFDRSMESSLNIQTFSVLLAKKNVFLSISQFLPVFKMVATTTSLCESFCFLRCCPTPDVCANF